MPAILYQETSRAFRQTIPHFAKLEGLNKTFFSNKPTAYCYTVFLFVSFIHEKKEEETKTTNKIIETKLSQQNIHLIQSHYPVRPPFTRMTANQQLRIEATYRIQVRCAIPFHPHLTNCSNCITFAGYRLLNTQLITSQI